MYLVEVAGELTAYGNGVIKRGAIVADVVDAFGWVAADGETLGFEPAAPLTFEQQMELGMDGSDRLENKIGCQEKTGLGNGVNG